MAKKRLSEAEAIQLLEQEQVGHLATCNPDGSPYITPLNYVYYQGSIFFHCALQGRKLTNISINPRVCFAVHRVDKVVFRSVACACTIRYHSVLAFGTACLITDPEQKAQILNALTHKFAAGQDFTPATLEAAATCNIVEISIDQLEGKSNVDPDDL